MINDVVGSSVHAIKTLQNHFNFEVHNMVRPIIVVLTILSLAACREEEETAETPIRGLKTHLVELEPNFETRRFPAVLEPAEIAPLSFEISGLLGAVVLSVGQRVAEGEVLVSLDQTSLEIQVESASASVDQARSAAQNAAETLERQQTLFERGTATKVAVDDAKVQADNTAAQLVQAEKSLETAEENLGKADLLAPFDGIINTVDATSFTTISPGTPVVTVYPSDSYEVRFLVSFDTVGQLVIGTKARIRLADQPDVVLNAVVSEIGARADSVSSFPVVLTLKETHPSIKAGMAVEASIDLPNAQDEGFAVPLSAIIRDGQAEGEENSQSVMSIFVFNPDTSRVERRDVTVGGLRENMIVVTEGLREGDQVASAGVSFLKDGQEVRLLTGAE